MNLAIICLTLPPISTDEICNIDDILVITITNQEDETLTYLDPKDPGGDVDRLFALLDGEHYEVISSLQDRNTYYHHVLQQLRKGKLLDNQIYKIENSILKRCLQIGEQVPLKTKQASEVLQAYIDNVYAKFGGSLKIL